MLVHRLLKRMLVHPIITKSDRGKSVMAMSAWFLRTFYCNHYIIKINHRDKQTLWSKRHLWYGVLYYTSSTLHETVCVWFWSCGTLTSITYQYMMKSVTGEKFTYIYSETGYLYVVCMDMRSYLLTAGGSAWHSRGLSLSSMHSKNTWIMGPFATGTGFRLFSLWLVILH